MIKEKTGLRIENMGLKNIIIGRYIIDEFEIMRGINEISKSRASRWNTLPRNDRFLVKFYETLEKNNVSAVGETFTIGNFVKNLYSKLSDQIHNPKVVGRRLKITHVDFHKSEVFFLKVLCEELGLPCDIEDEP